MLGRWPAVGLLVVACAGAAETPATPTDVSGRATVVDATDPSQPVSATPEEAALRAAHVEAPAAALAVTRQVLIYADSRTIDLRLQVAGEGFCAWYGVAGNIEDGSIAWRASPTDTPCE